MSVRGLEARPTEIICYIQASGLDVATVQELVSHDQTTFSLCHWVVKKKESGPVRILQLS